MKVTLLHSTPLWVCAKAIRKCWASEDKSDTMVDSHGKGYYLPTMGSANDIQECGPKDKELIERVGNKNKHSSTLEHLVYTLDIDGISRACLQELARHRIASYSVKSTRYTLKELKEEMSFISLGVDISRAEKYLVKNNSYDVFVSSVKALEELRLNLIAGISNDSAKYCLPEAYKTSLVMTINARSLQNFLSLRTSKSALWEIRDLANAIFTALPEEHKYLFEDYINTP